MSATIITFDGRRRTVRPSSSTSVSPSLGASLLNKLQRLVLERPEAISHVEHLLDSVLAHGAERGRPCPDV